MSQMNKKRAKTLGKAKNSAAIQVPDVVTSAKKVISTVVNLLRGIEDWATDKAYTLEFIHSI